MRAGVAVGIVAFSALALLAHCLSPESAARYNWLKVGAGQVYVSLAVGALVEVAAVACAVLLFGRDARGTWAAGAAVGGALGALASQYHPLLSDYFTKYLARPFSPVRLLGVAEHILGGVVLGCALAFLVRRAGGAQPAHAPDAPAGESAGALPPHAQRYALWGLLGAVGSALAVWLCVSFVGAAVGPRVVRTAAEWQTVRDGEEVEVRGVAGFDHSDNPFFPIDVRVVLEGERVVFCEFDSAVWETSDFRDWRNKIGPGSSLALRGTAHRNPAELRGCRPVGASK